MDDLDAAVALREGGVNPNLASRLEAQARAGGRSLDGNLITVEESVVLADTKATCRCHFIAFDGNDKPMVTELVDWLVAQTVDYCIPRSRISEAYLAKEKSGSSEALKRLTREADGLFAKMKTSGEGGEMLLYLLLEIGLGLPQLLCKMALKTDEDMHVHGTDGVHGRLLEDGTLALYWGESKLYANVNDAIDRSLVGLAPFLKETGGKAAKRDIYLLRDHLDLDSPDLTEALKAYFRDGAVERTKIQARGAALIGSSLKDYKYPLQEDRETATAEARALLESWKRRTELKIDENELAGFELELFFLPFPDVQAFRDELRAALGITE